MEEIKKAIAEACQELFNTEAGAQLGRPAEQFGDYATNVALQLAPKLNKNSREIAEVLIPKLREKLTGTASQIELAGPGFINFRLNDSIFTAELAKIDDNYGKNNLLNGKTVVIEHTDPNPFKQFHIGHAYSNTIGEALGRLLTATGAEVHQVSYHGDVGLHIAMAVWGIKHQLAEQKLTIDQVAEDKRRKFLGQSYAAGASAYQDDQTAQAEIKQINQHLYAKDDAQINELYEKGRAWSFAYFEEIYQKLNVSFEKQYFETETGPKGLNLVKENTPKVFEESDGAIIYRGEKAGLHTRVFITNQGLPTYESKELGLAYSKQADYPNAESYIVVTANEIDDYFKVLTAAINEIDTNLASKIKHISHGVVKLPSGKMSSRTGEVITAQEVLDLLEAAVHKIAGGEARSAEANTLGALKYTFLKHRIGADLVFDINESVSLEGNSGPYLQYAFARASSILSKAGQNPSQNIGSLEPVERSLLRKITEYPEVVKTAAAELLPSDICTYLYDLAAAFNHFYESNRVIGDAREAVRLQLVKAYTQVLKNGLNLLNIPAPEQM